MRIRVQQLNVIVGDITKNTEAIRKALKAAENEAVDLLVLPEMVVCGYPPMDLMERPSFIKEIFRHNEELIRSTQNTALLFGSVTSNDSYPGKPVFNSAVFAHQGECVGVFHKTLLPTYDVFDEFRHFEPNRTFKTLKWKGITWGITICEDIWNNQNEYDYHMYDVDPAAELRKMGAQVLVNISASPFTCRKPELRKEMLGRQARKLNIPLIYSNQVGANTELIFDGSGCALNPDGTTVLQLKTLEEDYGDLIWKSDTLSTNSPTIQSFPGKEERLFKALVMGLRDYVEKSDMPRKFILGLSGGIDSALTAVIAKEAIGRDHVLGITMPSLYSSSGSVSDSEEVAKNLGISFEKIMISDIYQSFLNELEPLFHGTEFGVAEENIQSRIRGALLMAVSNKFGHMLLNTGNKSELAVGYCTLYGDMAGGLSVLSDVYKTEVFALSKWLNEVYYQKEVIPLTTINKPPSAELRSDQKDTDSLPDYETLDGILKAYIEEHKSASSIIKSGFSDDIVMKVINLVDRNEYKRRQAAPGLRVSSKAFGSGRRLPIVQRWKEPI